MQPYYEGAGVELYVGDARDVLRELPSESVQCCVTSPPYWSLRVYGGTREIGSERTPGEFVQELVGVFREVRRALRGDGSLWLNCGDSYAASGKGGGGSLMVRRHKSGWSELATRRGFRKPPPGYKHKDLTLVPLDLAAALRDDGWFLRQTIIWNKGRAGEPPRLDRPSTSHEYIFLLTKSRHYAVRCPAGAPRWWQTSVWTITPDATSDHPATMALQVARRCVEAGSREGDRVLDPFAGAGTSLKAAQGAARLAIGIELNPTYADLAIKRLLQPAMALESA